MNNQPHNFGFVSDWTLPIERALFESENRFCALVTRFTLSNTFTYYQLFFLIQHRHTLVHSLTSDTLLTQGTQLPIEILILHLSCDFKCQSFISLSCRRLLLPARPT